jgi:hypothetical protein
MKVTTKKNPRRPYRVYRRAYRPQFLPVATERALTDAFRGVKSIAEARRKLRQVADNDALWESVRAGQEIRKSEEKNDAATARAVREATK